MPEFQPGKKKGGSKKGDTVVAAGVVGDEYRIEPRCHVCQHNDRHVIDKLIAIGTAYSQIARSFEGIVYANVRTHAKKHLNWHDAAVRELVIREAEKLQENIDEGVSGLINRRVYLEATLQKALRDMVEGHTEVEVKDAVAVIQLLEKQDTENQDAALETYKLQFNAFMEAIQEVAPTEMWEQIKKRAFEKYNNQAQITNDE
jgi:hypothetical protein